MTQIQRAEAEFQAHYDRGGTGLADRVWERIATKHGVFGLPFEPADLDALDAANHARDLRDEHYDNTRWDRD